MPNEVVDRDLGWSNLVKSLGDLGSPGVFVGLLQDKGGEMTEEGITLAGYAAVNEFGSEDGHVPERSFLRATMDEQKAVYEGELATIAGATVDAIVKSTGTGAGIAVLERGLGRLGLRAVRDVQDKIRAGGTPLIPNAPTTLARKYPANHPLIHTGRLRQAITFKVDMAGVRTLS